MSKPNQNTVNVLIMFCSVSFPIELNNFILQLLYIIDKFSFKKVFGKTKKFPTYITNPISKSEVTRNNYVYLFWPNSYIILFEIIKIR